MSVLRIAIASLFIPVVLFAQGTALPQAGFTPESPLYFLDRLGETVREFLTVNRDAKARLQITFAAERVAEIKIILEERGVDAPGLEVASSRLQENLAKVSSIVADKKAKGEDVSALAKELDDEFETPKAALEQAFKEHKNTLKAQEKDLREKLGAAREAGDAAEVDSLVQQLEKVKADRKLLESEKDAQEKALHAEESKIEKEMERKTEAEKAIADALREKQEKLAEATAGSVQVPVDALVKFDRLLAQAKELFGRENYLGAKQLAEQAEESLEEIDEAIEETEQAEDEENEMRDNEEKEAWEEEEREDEALKEEAEKSVDTLNKEIDEIEKSMEEAD